MSDECVVCRLSQMVDDRELSVEVALLNAVVIGATVLGPTPCPRHNVALKQVMNIYRHDISCLKEADEAYESLMSKYT